MTKCSPDCTCKRHKRGPISEETRAKMQAAQRCEPGCTCKRHSRVISDEHRQHIADANKARENKGKRCSPGCTCARHQAYYRGGSKKGRTFSDEARQNIAEGAQRRRYSPEETQRRADQVRAQHADPEWQARRIAALQDACIGVTCASDCTCDRHAEETRRRQSEACLGTTHTEETKRKISEGAKAAWAKYSPEERSQMAWEKIKKYGVSKVSNAEYALAPFLAKLGYKHNDDRALVVGRKFPDFYDEDGRRLFEYFGNYWHPRPEEEHEVIDHYQLLGWECTVLWEHDIFEWMREHKHLVTEEQYQGTWEIAQRRASPVRGLPAALQ